MSYCFIVDKKYSPLPMVTQFWGTAIRKGSQKTGFYLTVTPIALLLSVEPTEEGQKLIAYFTRHLGEPTLKYHDKHEAKGVDDYTAEWHLLEDQQLVAEQIVRHLQLGFSPDEIP